MMNKPLKTFLASTLTFGILAASFGAAAQLAPKPENLIKWRQSAYQVIAWNSGRIKAALAGTYNKDEVVKAANAIAAVSASGLPALFAPGTEQGKGWHDTSARPELFKDSSRFVALDTDFGKEAVELAKVASAGEADAVKAQFLKLNKTCKACHDAFKASE